MDSSRIAAVKAGDSTSARGDLDLRIFVFLLFFLFGGITSLNDVVIPKLKSLFTLSYTEAMLVQFAFFGAYLLISIPAAAIVRRAGCMRTAAFGLAIMMAGCLLFVPAASFGLFPPFLIAIFALAAGITTVQVVANPLISMLGDPDSASSRLTFAQGFNSLGTAIFPYVGSMLILRSISDIDPSTLTGGALGQFRHEETRVIVGTYIGLAFALAVLAIVVWVRRNRICEAPSSSAPFLAAFELLARPVFAFGTLSIFLYVGAEVSIGSLMVNFLMRQDVLALGTEAAGKRVPFYWGGAMVGRFVGTYILQIIAPGKVLAAAALVAITLVSVASHTEGAISGVSLLGVGLFNSIMFPTIFSLASEGLGVRAAEGSGVLCVAIVGGAIVPLIAGYVADLAGLRLALSVPVACYTGIAAFGLYRHRKPATQ